MEFLKKLIFFLLMPIVLPITLFLNATFDWWVGLGKTNKFLFILLAPIYGPLGLIWLGAFGWWVSLAE
jgi:hypothetical protein